jgi:hypothetical protein
MRKYQHLAAATDGGKGFANDSIRRDGDDRGVEGQWSVERGAWRARRLACCVLRVPQTSDFGPWKPNFAGAEFLSELEPCFKQVRGDHLHPAQRQEPSEHESDGPLPRYEDGVATQEGQAVHGLENGVDGFQHGAFEERITVWNLHKAREHKGHDADVFRIASARRFESGSDTGALVLGTLGKCMMAAGMAFEARNVMMQRDAFSGAELFHASANADDGAGRFVSENARRPHSAIVDFFDVCRANATSGNLNEDLMPADARNGQGFDAKVVWAAINDGAHGFRNFKHVEEKAKG